MKTVRYLFMVVGFGVLTHGLSFADEPSGQTAGLPSPSQNQTTSDCPAVSTPGSQAPGRTDKPDGKHSKPKDDNHASAKNIQAGPINVQAARTTANNLSQKNPQPDLSQAATVAKTGLVMNKIGNQPGPPAKPPIGSGITAPLSGVVRNRGAAAPIIGGLAAASTKTPVAVINGTAMKRKF
jgi:hypothetical protein